MADLVAATLSDHLARFRVERGGLVFTNRAGDPLRRSNFGDMRRRVVTAAALPQWATFHDLRHFYASLLIARGCSVRPSSGVSGISPPPRLSTSMAICGPTATTKRGARWTTCSRTSSALPRQAPAFHDSAKGHSDEAPRRPGGWSPFGRSIMGAMSDRGRPFAFPPVSRRRVVQGAVLAVALVTALGGAMFPLRSHLSVATTALVLVIPVVVGVAVGGFPTGLVATAAGFLVYDFVFIPPYYTLSVGAAQNWTALGVYGVVMVVVAQVVARMNAARASAQKRTAEVRRLFDLSEMLVREASAPELLERIVHTVVSAFELEGAALLLPTGGHLELAATAGTPLSEDELHRLSVSTGTPVAMAGASPAQDEIQAVSLTASGTPIGLLALRGLPEKRADAELLGAFANHLSLALERAQLQEQALRTQLLEEIDRLRRSLVGAVSHDLRTPLATIKVSASTLLDPDARVDDADARELLGLIDLQADRLDRLVANLLDMTRIQSGALELRREPVSVADLVDESLAVLGPSGGSERVKWRAPTDLPLVDVDHVLVCQALANLIDNAVRYSPADAPVTVSARRVDGSVEVTVADRGPGIPAAERQGIFEMFTRREAGGRGGLGLAIARAFVEAHGEHIRVEDGREGGTRFLFTLPISGES